jgi:hypothetical protein
MRTALWLLLVGIVLAVLALVGIPVWLVQPFAPQTSPGLAWSWTLRQAAPVATTVGLVLSLLLAALLWRGPVPVTRRLPPTRLRRWLRRVASRQTTLVLLVLPVAAATWFARQNHFEWMFRPFPDPQFTGADKVKDVKAGEPIIGVAAAGDALAFPITRIGYHHLVNTTLGGVPIVATY